MGAERGISKRKGVSPPSLTTVCRREHVSELTTFLASDMGEVNRLSTGNYTFSEKRKLTEIYILYIYFGIYILNYSIG